MSESEGTGKTKGKSLEFKLSGQKPRTLVWDVLARQGGDNLGYVAWFGRWRNYAFFPNANLVFDKNCLRDIAAFCEHHSAEHRKNSKAKKQAASSIN